MNSVNRCGTKISVPEIARMFNVTEKTVYGWVKSGLSHSLEKIIGKRTRIIICPDDVVAFHKKIETKAKNKQDGV